ncbi:MAG: DUF4258 domain-containing protein [Candidatus Lindowbacteria bacterium]|nr:DUF4258 domain-containing protein [Candidatus Lindowbacteria bacterium]
MDFILSAHTREMLLERRIPEEWVGRTINNSDRNETRADNNVHFFKSIAENEGRVLHVILNPHVLPKKVVTAFFDRRARRHR